MTEVTAMHMSQLLHRRSDTAHPTLATRPTAGPPPQTTHRPGASPAAGPRRPAGTTVALVVLGALLAGFVAIAAFGTDGSERRLTERIEALTEDRDRALAEVAAVDAELDDTRRELADARTAGDVLDERVATLRTQLDALSVRRAELEASVDELGDQRSELLTTVAGLEGERDVLRAALDVANERIVELTRERDALASLFPLRFDALAESSRLVGDWDLDLTSVHCVGLQRCDASSSVSALTVSRNADGWLSGNIPGLVAGGFFRVGDALHLVAASESALPAIDGAARRATVSLTLYPAGYDVDGDGSVVESMSGLLIVEAPAVGSAPAVTAYYGVELG